VNVYRGINLRTEVCRMFYVSQYVTLLQTHSIHMVSRGTGSIRSCLIFAPKGDVAYVALSTQDFDISFLRQVTRDESASDGF